MSNQPLPVKGYKPQGNYSVDLVNFHKVEEEKLLRHLDLLRDRDDIDQRWLAIGWTHLEQAFMAINRAVFQPERIAEEREAWVHVITELVDAWREYRDAHDLYGDGTIETGRAWDKMKRLTDAAAIRGRGDD